jgi:hypothetical protein
MSLLADTWLLPKLQSVAVVKNNMFNSYEILRIGLLVTSVHRSIVYARV